MVTDLLLAIGIISAAGFIGGLLAHLCKLPLVTGYIAVGILLSPSLLGVIGEETIKSLNIVTVIGLSVIAYAIGADLDISSIKKTERSIGFILPLQSLGTWLVVTLALMLVAPLVINIQAPTFKTVFFPVAFLLGAIAAATAPATTMAVVKESEAKGPMTTILLSMVALDDAITLIIFSVALGVSKTLVEGSGSFSAFDTLLLPFLKIAGALAIGAALGFLLHLVLGRMRERALSLAAVFGTVMICAGVTELLSVSYILANMVIGFVVVNLADDDSPLELVSDLEDIIFVLFFVLAGLHFDLGAIETAGLLALVIFVVRFSTKYFGSRLGARLAGAPKAVRDYLGLGMVPAAGVSIGLALLARHSLPSIGDIVLGSVLAFVILAELTAPPLVKYAIDRAGESGQCADGDRS